MTNKYFCIVFVVAFVLSAINAFACDYDMDCSVGSKCINEICVGGLEPGNENDMSPNRNRQNLAGTRGMTCSFDIQCGVGSVCLKSNYSIYGVCN